tara:strand:+ start:344 stop:973 length:630 start_codon:yes stop_codon:yes gene_type:complete
MNKNKIAQLGRAAAREKFARDPSPAPASARAMTGLKNIGSGMANSALQSPMGQGLLNAGANMYNQIPQTGRDWVGGKAMQMGGAHEWSPEKGSWQMPGFTPNPDGQVGVDASTTVENDELTEDRITTQTPGQAGSPWGQIARGAMTGQMPNRTYPQGTPLSNRVDVNMDELTGDRLVPQARFNEQYGGAAGLGQAAAQQPGGPNGPIAK